VDAVNKNSKSFCSQSHRNNSSFRFADYTIAWSMPQRSLVGQDSVCQFPCAMRGESHWPDRGPPAPLTMWREKTYTHAHPLAPHARDLCVPTNPAAHDTVHELPAAVFAHAAPFRPVAVGAAHRVTLGAAVAVRSENTIPKSVGIQRHTQQTLLAICSNEHVWRF
jgi:hypothetical protein